jgi:hypothetical protein
VFLNEKLFAQVDVFFGIAGRFCWAGGAVSSWSNVLFVYSGFR